MKLITTIKIISISSVGTRVLEENPLQAKPIVDYFGLSLFLYPQCLQELLLYF